MLAVQLTPEIENRLDALSRRTGRSRDEHVRDAILEHLENLEDAAVAEERLEAVRQGGETIPLEVLLKRYGVED